MAWCPEPYCLGEEMTFADIAVFHFVDAASDQFPEAVAELELPLLKAFQVGFCWSREQVFSTVRAADAGAHEARAQDQDILGVGSPWRV